MGRDTRDVIVDAAVELFHAQGYTATGVLDITKAAGVPKGSFYHFFPSKEALAEVAVHRYAETTDTYLLDTSDPSPLQRIHNHVDRVVELAEQNGYARGCLLGNFSTEMPPQSGPVSDAVAASLAHWVDHLADAIKAAQERDEVRTASDPRRLATHIVASIEGALAQAKLSRSREPIDLCVTTIFEDLLI